MMDELAKEVEKQYSNQAKRNRTNEDTDEEQPKKVKKKH